MIQRTDASDFAVELIFPPQGHFTQPTLALPCLAAYLEANGFGNVHITDASIEAYDRFLSAEYLEFAAERAARRLDLQRFEGLDELPFEELENYRAAVESSVSGAAVAAGIEDAKAVIRGERCFDADAYVPAVRTLYHGLRLVSAAWHPTQLTPHNFTMAYANDRSDEILAAVRDEDQNPFIEHFRTQLLPQLIERAPRVVGLSVIYGSQLIPALTLGRLIKEALPDCHVTAGGGFLAYIGAKLMAVPAMADCLDSIIFHEGEGPLLALCETLRAGGDLGLVGSLTWFDTSGDAPASVKNAALHPVKLDEAPVPNFDDLPLDKYFSPEVVIPYDINRGCYYGECAFCTLPTVIGPGYRTRSAGSIVDHVLALKEKHGTRNFNFITDCMPPGMIKDLPAELVQRQANIRWWADARVEPRAYDAEGAALLYESGCRKLLFGFETATPRLLKMMQKGQSLKSTIQVARNCAEAGISVTFYAMVGFPSETREEAQSTLDFIIEHSDIVREVSLQTFHIDEVAKTYKHPEQFGMRVISDPAADLQLYHDYESDTGMTQAEAAEAFDAMMSGFKQHLPIFSGDNIFYFMQKSHYFLHLARDTSPAEFVERCRARTAERTGRGAQDDLAPSGDLQLLRLPFSYAAVLERLAHPLARAIRPDFLTGRFVEGAVDAARAELTSVPAKAALLAYAGSGSSEFCELSTDAEPLLGALRSKGSLKALLDAHAQASPAARARVTEFAAELHRLGLLMPTSDAAALQPV